jgi:hypothetical protein
VTSSSIKPAYHLGEFPAIPKYSKEFYQGVPKDDKALMVEREYKLYQWKADAQRLESLYNK